MSRIENHTFDELAIGDKHTYTRTLTPEDFERFSRAAGELDPAAVESGLVTTNGFEAIAGAAGWAGALAASVIAGQFPGLGSQLVRQSLADQGPAAPGDAVTLAVTVRAKGEGRRVTLDLRAINQRGEAILAGSAEVVAPAEKIARGRVRGRSEEIHEKGRRYRQLLDMVRGFKPLRTAIVHPCDEASLLGAVEAAREKLIEAVLVGPEEKIRRAAELANVDLAGFEIVNTQHSHAAAVLGVAMAREGKVEALMKGALHTDELMSAVVDGALGLRTARRITHVFAIDAPNYPHPMFITDAAVNIYPNSARQARHRPERDRHGSRSGRHHAAGGDPLGGGDGVARHPLDHRRGGFVQDGRSRPDHRRHPRRPAGVRQRGVRGGGDRKGIVSQVSGRAEILVAPDLEAGNMLAKQLEYLADAEMAGIVLGARVPIMLTSRADNTRSRLGSCAIGLALARRAV